MGGDVRQQIILELMSQGDFNGAVQQFKQLRDEQGRFVAGSAAVSAAEKKVEDQTYETGNSYEVLEEQIKRATTAMEKESVAATWLARQRKELDEVLQGLADHEKSATTATKGTAEAGDNAAKSTKKAGDAGGYAALKWMLLGNAIQDAQYGFAAIVNNVPGIVMSFGGSAGLAGGIGIAAVAAQQLILHMDDIRKLLGEETEQRLVYDLKGLQKTLDDIDKKPIKSKIDYSDYERAKKELATLTEAQQAFDRLKSKQSKTAQEAGQLATEAIVEHGGGDDYTSSAERVARAAAAVSNPDESEPSRVAREKRDQARRQLDTATDPDQILGLESALARYNEEFTKARGEDHKNHLDVTTGKVGRASAGYSGDINWLRDLVQANPGAFKAQGVGPGLLPGLVKAGRDDIADRQAAENRAKIAQDDAKQAAVVQKQAAELEAKAQALKDKTENDKRKAFDAQSERMREAEDVAAGIAQGVDHEAMVKQQKATAKAAAAHKQAVDANDDPFMPGLQAAIAQNWLSQNQHSKGALPNAALAKRLESQVGGVLQQGGQDPGLAHDIVANAFEKANQGYVAGLARSGNVTDALLQVINQSLSMMGAQEARLSRQEMQAAQLGVKVNQMGGNMGRAQTRRPSLLTTFTPGGGYGLIIGAALASYGASAAPAMSDEQDPVVAPAITRGVPLPGVRANGLGAMTREQAKAVASVPALTRTVAQQKALLYTYGSLPRGGHATRLSFSPLIPR